MAFLFKRKDRDEIYYIERSVNGQIIRESTGTHVLQIAKQKLLDAQTAEIRGEDLFKPTRTSIADVLTKYVAYIRTRKTDKSVQTEIYYLREAFGPICDAVTITARKTFTDGSHPEAKSVGRRARRTPARAA
jgi:hypothetical protein